MFKSFFIALQFLTRLPVFWHPNPEAEDYEKQLGQSVLYYPMVGLIIGVLLVLLLQMLEMISIFPARNGVYAALLLGGWIMLTGALHLDGLADSVDAWVGGLGDRQRTLEIMKDPRSGPAGVTAIGLVLLLKFAALSVLVDHNWQVLLIAPILGRCAAVALLLTTSYVRPNGIGSLQASNVPHKPAWMIVIGALGFVVWLYGDWLPGFLIIVLLVWFWERYRMINRIGGTTGDTAGAMIEIIETATVITLSL